MNSLLNALLQRSPPIYNMDFHKLLFSAYSNVLSIFLTYVPCVPLNNSLAITMLWKYYLLFLLEFYLVIYIFIHGLQKFVFNIY